jgi:hypothetical protein
MSCATWASADIVWWRCWVGTWRRGSRSTDRGICSPKSLSFTDGTDLRMASQPFTVQQDLRLCLRSLISWDEIIQISLNPIHCGKLVIYIKRSHEIFSKEIN